MYRILLHSSDPLLAQALGEAFGDSAAVQCAATESWAHHLLVSAGADALFLDGAIEAAVERCLRLRQAAPLPLIALTAPGDVAERVRLLQAGADDVLSMPFEPAELQARLLAKLRRADVPPRALRRPVPRSRATPGDGPQGAPRPLASAFAR